MKDHIDLEAADEVAKEERREESFARQVRLLTYTTAMTLGVMTILACVFGFIMAVRGPNGFEAMFIPMFFLFIIVGGIAPFAYLHWSQDRRQAEAKRRIASPQPQVRELPKGYSASASIGAKEWILAIGFFVGFFVVARYTFPLVESQLKQVWTNAPRDVVGLSAIMLRFASITRNVRAAC